MYFEYYLYTYFCLSVVILPCALANINPGSIVKQTVVKNQEE